jgi:hypothetical protein
VRSPTLRSAPPDPWSGWKASRLRRWRSYLALLLAHDKPVWTEVESPSTSRISDEEMARINIESSAALAEWIARYNGSGDIESAASFTCQ